MTQAKQKSPDTETITLEKPIKRGETEIKTVDIRKPDSGALRGVSLRQVLDLQTDTIQTVTPRISEPTLIDTEVKQLDPADLLKIGVAIAGFFIPATAEGSEPPAK